MSRTHRLKPRITTTPLLPSVKPTLKRHRRAPYRVPLLVLLALLLASLVLLSRRVAYSTITLLATSSPELPPLPLLPPLPPADRCYIIGSDPARLEPFPLNARSLCVTSSICVSRTSSTSRYVRAGNRTSACGVLSTGLSDRGASAAARAEYRFGGCRALQRALVTCAHGSGLGMNRPACPAEATLSAAEMGREHWDEGVTVLVPEYPFEANIYHYGNMVAWVAYVKARARQLAGEGRVRVVFQGPRSRLEWQQGLLKAVLGDDVEFVREGDEEWRCMRKAVVLGMRGHVNVWPFGNDSAVATDGRSVPGEALRVREAAYRAAGVDGVFDGMRVRLPPRRVGYARRVGAAEVGDGKLAANVAVRGTERRFSEEEERWFVDMVQEECAAGDVEFTTFTTRDEGFEEQVGNAAGLGAMVGIHGANLVNGMFVRAFGAVVEVVPGGVGSLCYVGGMNSGLAYWRLEGEGEEVKCDKREIECRLRLRQRVVEIGAGRERLRGMVRAAVEHLNELWRRFPDGAAPVTRDNVEDRWHIQWDADE